MILEDGNNIYSIFYFFKHIKKFILKNLVELPINTTLTIHFHAQLEMNGILYIIKNNNNCIPINHSNYKHVCHQERIFVIKNLQIFVKSIRLIYKGEKKAVTISHMSMIKKTCHSLHVTHRMWVTFTLRKAV